MSRVTSFYARLDHRGTLALLGPDARKFLQGQVTCDIETLDEQHSITGAFCTPKGRMICDFRLLQLTPEEILMLVEADVVEPALAAFRKYIVFSKAEIDTASEDWIQAAVWGDGATGLIDAADRKAGDCWQEDGAIWTVVDESALEICCPHSQWTALEQRLDSIADAIDAARYRAREIASGTGHVRGPTVEEFLPQMLNYQLTDRVSFTKGCYTGQEVVARMHYRGKLKRAMLLASAAEGEAAPGDALYAIGGEQEVGQVVNAEADETGGVALLAVISLNALDGGISLGRDGPELGFPPMPYALESDDSG